MKPPPRPWARAGPAIRATAARERIVLPSARIARTPRCRTDGGKGARPPRAAKSIGGPRSAKAPGGTAVPPRPALTGKERQTRDNGAGSGILIVRWTPGGRGPPRPCSGREPAGGELLLPLVEPGPVDV